MTTIDRATVEQALEALERSETTVQYEGFGMARRDAERKHQAAIDALRAALAQQAEPVDTDCHTQGICQRSGYGIGKQSDPQIEDRLARHGINPCPDCRGIGYDASGQLCWCQQNPSF